MKISVDNRFFSQSEKFNLKFCCESCAYFSAEESTCAHFWPVGKHLVKANQPNAERRQDILFCKEFELVPDPNDNEHVII